MSAERKFAEEILQNVKISYPSLFKKTNNPKFPQPAEKWTYNCKFYLNKTKHADLIAKIINDIKVLCKDHKMAYSDNKYSIFEDMGIVADADPHKEPLRDYFKLSAKNFKQPNVSDINNKPVFDEELVRDGDIVHAQVKIYAVPKDRPTLLTCELHHVKHIRHEDPIRVGSSPEDATDKFAMLLDDVAPESEELESDIIPF